MVNTQDAAPTMTGAAASTQNANNGYNKNNGGILVVPQKKKKDKHCSLHADHSKVEVLISRESAVLLLRSFPDTSLADILHLAMMTSLECRARDVLHTMNHPILRSTPEMKRKIRAALVTAAELMPFAVELMLQGKGCPVGGISGPLLDYIRDEASSDCFETELGGFAVHYRFYGKKSGTSHQVVDKTLIEPQESTTLPMEEVFGHIVVAETPGSAPPSPSDQATREAAVGDDAGDISSSHDRDSSTPCKPPLSPSSGEEGSSSSPTTPPLSPPPAFVSHDSPPALEPPSLALLPPSPPTPPTSLPPPPLAPTASSPAPSTVSANPLGNMFSPPLDKPRVIAVVGDVLCSQRVINDRNKTVRVLAELESGCISGKSMEWVIRGLRTVRGKREMRQRHGGLVFVGPQWGAPVFKTRNGARRLLHGVAKKHEPGTRFVVCASPSLDNTADNVKIITGIISASASDATAAGQARAPASATARIEPVMDGDVPKLDDWANIRGNLEDGCRLWAWVY